MPVALDQDPKLAQYAHPERLVTTDWLAEHLGDPGLVVVEIATRTCCSTTPATSPARSRSTGTPTSTTRSPATTSTATASPGSWARRASAATPRSSSTATRTTGGRRTRCGSSRCSATRTCACSTAAATKWIAEGRELTTDVPTPAPVEYPVVERDDAPIRAFKDDVLAHLGGRDPLIDVRSPEEYTRRAHAHARLPAGGRAARRAHPGRARASRGRVRPPRTATFKRPRRARGDLHGRAGPQAGRRRRSPTAGSASGRSHTWFVLTYLLGFESVRNYDGSWTEWGNTVRVPIVRGEDPGSGSRQHGDVRVADDVHLRGRRDGGRPARPAGPRLRAADAVAAGALGSGAGRPRGRPGLRAGSQHPAAAHRARSRPGWSGVERSPAYAALAREQLADLPEVEIVEDDVTQPLPVEDADLVFARFLLTHLAAPRRGAAGWARRSRPAAG